MKKTSVYLPEGLKDRLSEVAHQRGASEAQLIRLAVERLVATEAGAAAPIAQREDPVAARHRPGPAFTGVGVGPGDPGLVTLRAVELLRDADRVLAPSTSLASVGRAEAIVRGAAPDVVVERVRFVMEVDTDARARAITAAAEQVAGHLDAGERVAFITLGDPNIYSTFSSVADEVRRLRPSVPVDVVPGIMAFQDLAARHGVALVDGAEHLVLVPAHAAGAHDAIAAAAADPSAALVIYKGGTRLAEVADVLAAHDRLDGAVLGELLGLPGGRVQPVAEALVQPASYLATVIVPPVRPAPAEAATTEVDATADASADRAVVDAAPAAP